MLRPTFKIICNICGRETDAQNLSKKTCWSCKMLKKRAKALDFYHKKEKYKCVTCSDKCYNEVNEQNTQCGFCKSIYEKHRVQETNITTSERKAETETRKAEIKNVGKKTSKKDKIIRKKN